MSLLSRVGELGVDTSDLIVRRFDAKTDTVRKFAAIAACRATDDIWTKIEPVALSRLRAMKSKRLGDEDSNLMLALIRHGRKDAVADFLESDEKADKSRIRNNLSRLESGFSPDHCRDRFL